MIKGRERKPLKVQPCLELGALQLGCIIYLSYRVDRPASSALSCLSSPISRLLLYSAYSLPPVDLPSSLILHPSLRSSLALAPALLGLRDGLSFELHHRMQQLLGAEPSLSQLAPPTSLVRAWWANIWQVPSLPPVCPASSKALPRR